MNITYHTYIELPAPLSEARAALRDPATWEALPIGARRMGEMWRHGSELYTITADTDGRQDDNTLHWHAAPVALPGMHLYVAITLHDAVIATHASVRVSLQNRGAAWPWQRAFYHWKLADAARRCCEGLQGLLRQRVIDQRSAAAPRRSGSGNGVESMKLTEQLRAYYPQTVAHFEQMGAHDHLERVWWLERSWERILRGEYAAEVYETLPTSPTAPPQPPTPELDYDLIYAGGGLGLLHAAAMAQCYGWRVMLFDRGEVGCVHREWNISHAELQALVDMGLLTWAELETVMMREYSRGVVSFHTSTASKLPHSDLWFSEVLNVAIDAGGLLQLMRRKFEQAGGTVLDRRSFRCVRSAGGAAPFVEVVLESLDSKEEETCRARLLLDGMGSTSPLALRRHAGEPFAGVCPTVGTVVSGLEPGSDPRQHNPDVGDILISVDDTQDGQQMIWEGFPGRGDELTVYVFYYAALREAGQAKRKPLPEGKFDFQPAYSLLDLFEQYFAMLPSYKRPGPDFKHVKPVYGYIPGRHSLNMQEAPLLRGVLPVGDSAAQQSPLTYCGFGSHVRNLKRTTSLLDYALHHNLLEPRHLRHISAFQTNVSLNWIFSRFMQPWQNRPHSVNELQNAFLGALNELGSDLASRFFRDRMHWSDYNKVVWYTMLRYPDVFVIAWPVLGVTGVWQWFLDYLRFSTSALYAAGARAAGPRGEQVARKLGDQLSPALSMRVRARYAEWRAMGWLDAAQPPEQAPVSSHTVPEEA